MFDYLPTTREQASGGSSSPYQSRQQQQNQQVVVPPPPTYSRHQSTRSVSYSSRPASIPEDTRGEDSLQQSSTTSNNGHHHQQHQLGDSTSSSSSAGMSSNRAGGGNNTHYVQGGAYGDSGNINTPNTAIGSGPTSAAATSAGLAPIRSTSSLASLGQQTTGGTTISISSSNTSLVGISSGSAAGGGGGGGNDGASTAPSSQAGHGNKHGGHTHAGTTGIHPNYSSKMTMTQAGGGDMNGSSSSQATSTPNNGNATTLEGSHTSAAAATAANNTSAASIAAAQRANAELAEQMQKLCMDAMSNYQCMVTCSPFFENTTTSSSSPSPSAKVMMTMSLPSYNFILSGGYQQVMAARGFILRTSPFYKKSIVKVPRSEVLSSSSSSSSSSSMTNNGTNGHGGASSTTTTAEERVKPEMKNKLDEIAALTRAHLAIVGQQQQQQRQESSSSRVPTSASSAGADTHDAGNGVYNGGNGSGSGSTMGFGLETERFVEIVITGSYESVEQARVRLLVLLDELVSKDSLYMVAEDLISSWWCMTDAFCVSHARPFAVRPAFRHLRNRLQTPQHNFRP